MSWNAGQTITGGLLNDCTIQVTTSAGLGSLAAVTGMVAFCTDTLQVVIYTGSVWIPVGGGIVADPKSSSSNGTSTSGSIETEDSVLGVYSCQLVSGRWYQVVMDGLLCSGSVANDLFRFNIRDGGTSAPTTSSTAVASVQWECITTGGAGQVTTLVRGIFQSASTGTHQLAFFAVRQSGTGVFTPVGTRSLYVVDLGSS